MWWNSNPTRGCPYLTEEEIDKIAERAADKAVEKVTVQAYQAIGKGVVTRFLWMIGLITAGFVTWLHTKGFL